MEGAMKKWMVLAMLVVGCNGSNEQDSDAGDADTDTDTDADVDADADTDDDTDSACTDVWHRDLDQDGYGSPIDPVTACEAPLGYVADGTDCNDTELTIHPGATEVCDELDLDEDCDGETDDEDDSVDPYTFVTWYQDFDDDGYGSRNENLPTAVQCDEPGSLWAPNNLDCLDTDPTRNPGATEVCDGYIDEDCDGDVDEGC
jgi:hypothetical protein